MPARPNRRAPTRRDLLVGATGRTRGHPVRGSWGPDRPGCFERPGGRGAVGEAPRSSRVRSGPTVGSRKSAGRRKTSGPFTPSCSSPSIGGGDGSPAVQSNNGGGLWLFYGEQRRFGKFSVRRRSLCGVTPTPPNCPQQPGEMGRRGAHPRPPGPPLARAAPTAEAQAHPPPNAGFLFPASAAAPRLPTRHEKAAITSEIQLKALTKSSG
jgi:hypothetical protein